jgi:hypothetical protein
MMSSTELRHREDELLGKPRFMSIDGGHTTTLTWKDLHVVDAALVERGLCCVDDFLKVPTHLGKS